MNATPAQVETTWPLNDIADVLGGALRGVKPGVWQIDVPSKPLGTSLALQLAPAHGAVRLEPEREKRAGPWTIGSITSYGIGAVEVASTTRAVIFRARDQPPHELTVTHLGQFQLARIASQFPRGQRVKVAGVRRPEKWRTDGVTHIGSSILVTAIEAV